MSCQQMVSSNSGRSANEGISLPEPVGSSTHLCWIALYKSREPIRSKHVLHRGWPKEESVFSPVKHRLFSVPLNRYSPGDAKKYI